MARVKMFATGLLFGLAVCYLALQFHVLRSDDGIYLVPRATQSDVTLACVDIRDWDATRWAAHPQLVAAVTQHGAEDLMIDSVIDETADGAISEMIDSAGKPLELTGDEFSAFHESADAPADVPRDGGESQSVPSAKGRSRVARFLDRMISSGSGVANDEPDVAAVPLPTGHGSEKSNAGTAAVDNEDFGDDLIAVEPF